MEKIYGENSLMGNSYDLELKELINNTYINDNKEEKQKLINTVQRHKSLFKKLCDFVSINTFTETTFKVCLDTNTEDDYTTKLALDFFFPAPFDKYTDYLVTGFIHDPRTNDLDMLCNYVFEPKGVFVCFSFGSSKEFDKFQKIINKLNEEFAVRKKFNVNLLRAV